MFTKSDAKMEEEMLTELIESDPEADTAYRSFLAEMEFKRKLLEVRKEEALTQKDIAERTGLSQQAVSRVERVQGTTLETVIRYLASMGYVLGIEKSAP